MVVSDSNRKKRPSGSTVRDAWWGKVEPRSMQSLPSILDHALIDSVNFLAWLQKMDGNNVYEDFTRLEYYNTQRTLRNYRTVPRDSPWQQRTLLVYSRRGGPPGSCSNNWKFVWLVPTTRADGWKWLLGETIHLKWRLWKTTSHVDKISASSFTEFRKIMFEIMCQCKNIS